mmetsp:Transcript_152672/g.487827  ORF Transcript_152672/g.487827 Transcript_152672/m.487827 type:complete len:224 (+) Transcript_152672:970-1641(+)
MCSLHVAKSEAGTTVVVVTSLTEACVDAASLATCPSSILAPPFGAPSRGALELAAARAAEASAAYGAFALVVADVVVVATDVEVVFGVVVVGAGGVVVVVSVVVVDGAALGKTTGFIMLGIKTCGVVCGTVAVVVRVVVEVGSSSMPSNESKVKSRRTDGSACSSALAPPTAAWLTPPAAPRAPLHPRGRSASVANATPIGERRHKAMAAAGSAHVRAPPPPP